MLIVQIELENFKSYAHATIRVEPGANAIVGANGAGKSSLLEAVGFCLFDASPSGFNLSNLLREGAVTGRVVVTMLSSEDERLYEVERGFSSSATSRYRVYDVELDRAIVAEGKESVLGWVRQHLQMEPTAKLDDFFENTIGVPQGTFTAPFLQAASARKSIFDPLLQVEDYRRASDGLRSTMQLLDQRARSLAQEIAYAEGQLVALPDLEHESEVLAGSIASLAAQEGELASVLGEAERELARHDSAERDLSSLTAQLTTARAQQEALTQRRDDARRVLAEAEEAATIVALTRADHQAFVAAEEALADLERRRLRRDDLLAQRATLDRDRATASTQHQQALQKLREIEAAAQALQGLAAQVAEQLRLEEALREAERDCAQLEETIRRREELKAQRCRAEADVARLMEDAQRAEELDARLTAIQGDLVALRLAQREHAARLATIKAESERLRAQATTLQDARLARCPVCESELTPEHRLELLGRSAAYLVTLQADHRQAQRALEADESKVASLEAEVGRLRRERDALAGAAALAHAQERLVHQQELWEAARAQWQALAAAPPRREALQRQLAALGDPRGQARLYEALVAQQPALLVEGQRLQAHCLALEKRLSEVEQSLVEHASLNDEIAAARDTRERHRAAHERHLAHQHWAAQVETRRGRVAQLDGEHRQALYELVALDAQVQQAQAQYDEPAHRAARELVVNLRDRAARLSAQRAEQESRQRTVTHHVAALHVLQCELARQQAEQTELVGLRALLQTVRDLLRQAGPHITRQLVRRISHEASAFYAEIMGDHGSHLLWAEDYDLSLEVRGARRAFRQLSGGEQMCAALALRLALLREMSHIDIAFFDEPTTNLDAERRDGLAERIMQVRGFGQLFVISHDDSFERAAQNYIRIVKDAAGSRVEEE